MKFDKIYLYANAQLFGYMLLGGNREPGFAYILKPKEAIDYLQQAIMEKWKRCCDKRR
jgi:hypothetical protein